MLIAFRTGSLILEMSGLSPVAWGRVDVGMAGVAVPCSV